MRRLREWFAKITGFVSLAWDRECCDVAEFHHKFGLMIGEQPRHLTKRKLGERVEFLQEELDELRCAMETQDMAEIADALVDMVYVAKGTAVMLGLPWEPLWADVQRANLGKVRGVGKRGHLVDCVKPPGWVGPRTTEILLAHGYNPLAFGRFTWAGAHAQTFHCDEERCHDDQPV